MSLPVCSIQSGGSSLDATGEPHKFYLLFVEDFDRHPQTEVRHRDMLVQETSDITISTNLG